MPQGSNDTPPIRSNGSGSDPYSILLMGFGQSNADVHDAGPRLAPEAENALPIFMPNDGKFIRGYMGGERIKKITGFDHVSDAPPTVQSLLVAAAARLLQDFSTDAPDRVIVRSEARGGRRFLGIEKGDIKVDGIYRTHDGTESIIFKNLIATLTECIEAAQADGCPVRLINMIWLHGESDRAMAREVYCDLFSEFIDDVEKYLAPLGVEIHWTLVQPGGTGQRGGGNFWPNRLALFDMAVARGNIDVALTGYAYEQFDGSHYSANGKLLMGENLGRIIASRLAGVTHLVPQLVSAKLKGRDVILGISAEDPIFLDTETIPLPDGTISGFHTRDRNHTILQEVTVVAPDKLRLRFDKKPDPATLMIHYAYKHHRRGDPSTEVSYPVGRGCLRTTKAIPSNLMADTELYDWAACFSVCVADMM